MKAAERPVTSGMSFLDSLIVNVASPEMDGDLGLGVTGLQWKVRGRPKKATA